MRNIFRTRAFALSALGLVGLALQGTVAPAKAYDINVILALSGGGLSSARQIRRRCSSLRG